MNLRQIAIVALAALALSACGGGGGGGGGGGAGSAPPTYILTPATLQATAVAGYSTTVNLSAKQSVTLPDTAYLKVVPDADVIDPNIIIYGEAGGTFNVQVKTAALKAGHYAGNITINVCADAGCNSHLAGSPFKLPYDIDVVSADGALFAYNQSPLSALPGAPDWETFQANAQHTGYVPVSLNPAQFSARWKWIAPANAGELMQPSTLATGGGRFYVSIGSGNASGTQGVAITAYNESDGSKAWSYSPFIGYSAANPPAFSGGRVFVAAGWQYSTAMFAFDAASGAQLFSTAMTSQWESYLAPTIFNGNVFSEGGYYGGLYSFAAATGIQNFYASLPQYEGWTPAVDAQNLYVYLEGKLHMVDPDSGAVRATIADPGFQWNGYTVAGAPVIGAGGIVFAGNLSNPADNAIVAFDTLAQSVRWTSKGAYSGNPAYVDGLLFAANSASGMLEARKESDGTVSWSWMAPSDDRHFVSDVLATKNLVFLSTDSTTYAVDRTSHAAVWSYKAGGKLALSANGILYIKGASTIVAINLK